MIRENVRHTVVIFYRGIYRIHVFNNTVKMRINSLSNVHTSQRDVFCVVFLLFLVPYMPF